MKVIGMNNNITGVCGINKRKYINIGIIHNKEYIKVCSSKKPQLLLLFFACPSV
jgi:hypothetical protein